MTLQAFCCSLIRSQSIRQSVQYLNTKESKMKAVKKGSTKGGKGGKGGCK